MAGIDGLVTSGKIVFKILDLPGYHFAGPRFQTFLQIADLFLRSARSPL